MFKKLSLIFSLQKCERKYSAVMRTKCQKNKISDLMKRRMFMVRHGDGSTMLKACFSGAGWSESIGRWIQLDTGLSEYWGINTYTFRFSFVK